ncbi:uncharacterized protein LOC124119712 [Haliotis rufescens]|uniref:uncharacterized protein LOC124119712 n=1 Tax=Haliotis rufescens TaxID=6454 RepID=UPI00201EEC65|nr:uncharacterized protein LOC124119712 [Haliotis rufescens]
MPKKGKGKGKGKDKGKKGKKGRSRLSETDDVVMKKLLKCYERNCALTDSQMCPGVKAAIKAAMEGEKLLTRFILESVPQEQEGDLPVLLEPFLASIRQERYILIKDLHIWDYPMSYENVATLSLLMEKPAYLVRQLEMMDCLLEANSINRFSRIFRACDTLTILNLDYNEFGDEGCQYLCRGLDGNVTMLSLSLCYCDLGKESGRYLGHILSTTAVREMYLDGNNLECEGVTELIKLCVDQAEAESFQKAEAARIKEQEEALKAELEKENRYTTRSEQSGESDGAKSPTGKKKKKKGKKKKKTKEPPAPPPVGPWVYKLHVADNGIDAMGESREIAPIICMRLFRKLLMCSHCLEELDLEDNLIGDLGGREIVEGLMYRKEEKLGGVKMRTTHRMNADTFNTIIKLGSGLKKKKKGKKKGKKKKK